MTPATDDQVLDVARRHGTDIAAVWAGISRATVVKLRRRVDGYGRGRGHPTVREMRRTRPNRSCPCPRCVDWRAAEAIAAERRAERAEHERVEAERQRKQLAARLRRELAGVLEGTDHEWRLRAACLGYPREMFFGYGQSGRGGSDWIEDAVAICDTCPVRAPCKAEADATAKAVGGHHGVWAGTTEGERRGWRRQRKTA